MANIPVGYKQTEVGVIPADWEADRAGKRQKIINKTATLETPFGGCAIAYPPYKTNSPHQTVDKCNASTEARRSQFVQCGRH